MNTPKRKPASKAPAKNKPGPKPGTGGRPLKTPGTPRVKTSLYLAADTLARLRATGEISATIDRLAADHIQPPV